MKQSSNLRRWPLIAIIASLVFLAVIGILVLLQETVYRAAKDDVTTINTNGSTASGELPEISTRVVVENLDHPWDIAFIDADTYLYTQRAGVLSIRRGEISRTLNQPSDIRSGGEGGLMGVAVDTNFSANRYVYTCYNSTVNDVRVVRYRFNEQLSQLADQKVVISGIPSNASGRHSGCKVLMDTMGTLWVGTGDAANASNPQDPKSLGGKILRVDRDGKAVIGNLGSPYDNRIYSYGHRNVQGLAFFKEPRADGVIGLSAEQGPSRDDEINELSSGNFGWRPGSGYNENVPMTDNNTFPDARSALWSSGSPTIALSGITIINGRQWKAWDGAVAGAALKGRQVRIIRLESNNKVIDESTQLDNFGRVRTVAQSPDGSLYLLTDNGSGRDQIVKVIAK